MQLDRYEVDENGCWIWQGYIDANGYGNMYVGRKMRRRPDGKRPGGAGFSHRAFWQAHRGPIPDGMHVDHLCRVRCCVNPDHMELVTIGENTRRGALAKLTWADVKAIRRSSGGNRPVAREYGVDHSVVSRIRSRQAWWPEP